MIFHIVWSLLIPCSMIALDNITILQKYLPENPIIVEAGAHKGTDTVKLSALWPQGVIYAFEPVVYLWQDLQQATRELGNVHLYNYALADTNGTALLYISSAEGTGSSSLLTPKKHLDQFPWISFPEQYKVATITLDTWMQQEELDKVDLLWLDLQGAEYNVLKASPLIMEKVTVIATEVNFQELYEGACLYPVYKQWLEDRGFVEVFLESPHVSWGDAVFVRKGFLSEQ